MFIRSRAPLRLGFAGGGGFLMFLVDPIFCLLVERRCFAGRAAARG